jgi:hypothetical protein
VKRTADSKIETPNQYLLVVPGPQLERGHPEGQRGRKHQKHAIPCLEKEKLWAAVSGLAMRKKILVLDP